MGSAWPVGDFGNLWNDDLAARHRGAGYSPAITGTPVDLYVYDTSKDSDGGAWRKRTQHTSWYNETLNTATRGARREFPAVAVIVAEATKVTIYDGDDPDLPMWMVFEAGTNDVIVASTSYPFTGVSILNGELAVSHNNYGLFRVNFTLDAGECHRTSNAFTFAGEYKGSIAQRNDGLGFSANHLSSDFIVNSYVKDVAMTVLPDAPIDPATGLPVPTIAVATNGGVSVIKDDGTVVDSATTLGIGRLFFDGLGGIFYKRNTTTGIFWYSTKDDYTAGDGFGDEVARTTVGTNSFDILAYDSLVDNLTSMDGGLASGGSTPTSQAVSGLMLHQPNYTDQSKGMSALLTSTYNTGWMNGDIKGAFLSDTDDTDLVGSGELVTNGDFATDVSGWTAASDGRNSISWQSGKLRITNITASYGYAFQTISTVVGKTYTIQWTPSAPGSSYATRVYWGNSEGTTSGGGASAAAVVTGAQSITFVATTTTTYLAVQLYSATAGAEMDFDNISVKLADADRSVNNKGLVIVGTVTRSAVATGAELVAYSGFSASNYLEQPYNSDLDFGTGDFCVMGWVRTTDTSAGIVERTGLGDTNNRFAVDINGTFRFFTDTGSAAVANSGVVPSGKWQFVCGVRSASGLQIYVDGQLRATNGAAAQSVTKPEAVVRIGDKASVSSPLNGDLALLRISATAPSADQIAKIYNDEKVLFQENAACTLYGSSDAVTALAHDPVTGLLHVGTSAGRSIFKGFLRVHHTATAVATSISAVGGLIAEK